MNESTFDAGDSPDELVAGPSFYEVLDVAEDADDFEIDGAFARWLQEPDQSTRLNSARKHAWEVLRDPVNRSFYDEHLARLRARAGAAAAKLNHRGVGSMSTFTLGSAQAMDRSRSKGRQR